MTPKFPQVEVQLTGADGNAHNIIGMVRRAMRKAGIATADIDDFTTTATSGDYDNVIATAMRYVTVH